MEKKHRHHVTPVHKGGTDDPDNIVELDFIEHARVHAERFLDGEDTWFDFRHLGWRYLHPDLRNEVLKRASQVCKDNDTAGKMRESLTLEILQENGRKAVSRLTFEQKSKGGKKSGQQNVESGQLKRICSLGGKAAGGKNFTDEGRRKANETKTANGHYSRAGKCQKRWVNTHPDFPPFVSTGSGLTRWQRKRGIDESYRKEWRRGD